MIFALVGMAAFVLIALVVVLMGALFIFGGDRALSGVSVAGIPLGGLSRSEVEMMLSADWPIRLVDGDRTFTVSAAQLGIALDAPATAARAVSYGRSEGGIAGALRAAFGRAAVPPVVHIAPQRFETALRELAPQIDLLPVNAGVQIVDGAVQPRPAQNGRLLDIGATLQALLSDPSTALADGELELQMIVTAPEITDASGMVTAAQALLANPLQIRAYDPINDESLFWTALPQEWSAWLIPAPISTPNGLTLTVDDVPLRAFLSQRAAELGSDRTINLDESVTAVQNAVMSGGTTPWVRIYHRDIQYTVQPGDSIINIAYEYGIPYPYIEQANPGVSALTPGQVIILPSRDVMLPYPVVPNKRIIVSISEQRVRVYENGALKWDWPASTGITSSPTWPGVYQIISHEPNAYAGNWDLWMPNFMGVYRPIPGADFTNGFHGFPTRGGSQLLWTNSLGTRVTYGCILLSDENVRALYEWAEEGVVVEILP